MLKHLSIKNFKGWKDTGNIELAPITVFFGSNSSGKSSIGQFLVMLKQTIQQPDRKTVLMLSGDKASVNLGTPADIFYNHDMNEKIQFEYEWDLEKQAEYGSGKSRSYDTIKFHADIQVNNPEVQYLEVNRFSYGLLQDDKQKLTVGMKKSDDGSGSRNYELFSEVEELKRTKGRPWKLSEPMKYYGFPDAALAYYQDADFLQDLNLHQENLFNKFFYLGPLRTKSSRIYSWAGTNPDSVGDDGRYTIQAILSAKHEGRKFNFLPHQQYRPFEAIIGAALKKMELIEEYKINRIENRQDYEVKVKIKGASEYVSLPDVGFGVSQVLPVIVQLFYAPSGSVIFIEQPEIHLHPKAQTLLADVIIDVLNMRENYKERKIQVIIETHSEYLLRRLQMRISDETMKTGDLRAYFAHNKKSGSVLEELKVDTYGNILNWPEGFFGDMEKDMYEQAMNAMNRRITERNAGYNG
ncbi:MAG: DUF3696 domain-containing protein [Lachnospiraceae bacterium]|nr:DUF3696 domain-containing protein [Lachnospiraceae bacterium]